MKARRRIFRRSIASVWGSRIGWKAAVWAGLACCVAGVAAIEVSPSLLRQAASVPERLHADPGTIAVVGGDTLRLHGQVVRLSGVEAPNRGDRCKGGVDCGGEAASALAGLVRDREVSCRVSGQDDLGRPYASCAASGLDLSSAIVASGWARATEDRPMLAELELRARRQGAGLWASRD